MRIITLAFIVFTLLPGIASAQSDAWSTSFESDNLDELVDSNRVIVISATPEAAEASQALVDALRERGLELVMTDEALGETSALSDQQLVDKGMKRPVDGVVIVRVYPSKSAPTAVITHTFGDGFVSASIVAGQPPRIQAAQDHAAKSKERDPRAEHEADARSRAQALAASLPERSRAIVDERQALQRGKYQREKIVYRDEPWSFHLGAFEKPLAPEAFYQTIRREDLADTYASNVGLKTGVLVGSGVATALGLGLMFVGIVPAFDDQDINWLITGLGIGSSAFGMGGIIWGATLETHPVDEARARQLADEHNAILRNEYGVRE